MADCLFTTGYQIRYRYSGITRYTYFDPTNILFILNDLTNAINSPDVIKISFYFNKVRNIMIQCRQDEIGIWEYYNWNNLFQDEFDELCHAVNLFIGVSIPSYDQ